MDHGVMERWKEDFLIGLRQGKPVDFCARTLAGMPLAVVHEARRKDPAFAAAWDEIAPVESETCDTARTLTPAALEALMWAQCSDEEAAGYFSMEVGEFKAAVAANAALARIHKIAPLGGKAALKRSQFEGAMAGDRAMQTWLGKQHLGQAEKVEQTITRKDDDSPADLARKLAYILAQGGVDPGNILEGQIIDVEPLALEHEAADDSPALSTDNHGNR